MLPGRQLDRLIRMFIDNFVSLPVSRLPRIVLNSLVQLLVERIVESFCLFAFCILSNFKPIFKLSGVERAFAFNFVRLTRPQCSANQTQ